MTNQNEIIEKALEYYDGWFDENNINDAEIIKTIEEALNSSNPLDYSVTDDALMNFKSYLEEGLTATKIYNADDIKDMKAAIKTINSLLQ